MKERTRRRLGIALAVAAVVGNYGVCAARQLPDTLSLSLGQTGVVQTGLLMRVQTQAVQVLASGDEHLGDVTLCAQDAGEASVTFSLLGLLPVHETKVSVSQERVLIPGGQAVGVALKTRGVLVIGHTNQAGQKAALRVGDVILTAQGTDVDSAKVLSELVNCAQTDTVELSVLRAGNVITVEAAAVTDEADGQRRLGIWVRDSTAGVGTLSYIDPQTMAYGALGHAIVDADTGSTLEAKDGAILRAQVVGVTRGQSGKAGELKGSFLKENEQIGSLVLNSAYGIYGQMDALPDGLLYPQGLPVGSRSAVHTGAASILTTVDGDGPQEYSVEIVRCFAQEEPSQKGMLLRVTDERLLEQTGGIVQGMSGSPILQDGRIIGAVTHVTLSDAAQGYGMYIEWMLRQSDGLELDAQDDAPYEAQAA